MAFTLRIPSHIIRRIVAGTITAGSAGFAYQNGVRPEDISHAFDSGTAILKASGITQLKLADIYKLLTWKDSTSISDAVALQLASDPQIVDYLWSTFEHSDISLLPSIVHIVSAQDDLATAQLLARAPSLELLQKLCLKESTNSPLSVPEFDPRFRNPPLQNPEHLVVLCKQNEDVVPSHLLFFVLTHHPPITTQLSREDVQTILETCINNVLVDLVKFKHLLLQLVDNYYDYFTDAERAKILLPILIRLLRSPGILASPEGPLIIEKCTKLISSVQNLDMQSSSILPSLIELANSSSNDSDRRYMILRLVLALKRSSPKMKIISPEIWIDEFFAKNSIILLDLISVSLSDLTEPTIHSILSTSVANLERKLQVTDYESNRKKKAVESSRDRPIVDTDLYAFHDEEEEDRESVDIDQSNTSMESLVERLGILAEITRTNRDTVCAEFLARVVYPLLIESEETSAVSKWRVLANISTLGRMVSTDSRNEMIEKGRNVECCPSKIFSSKAEMARLKHNLRCLPIRSAPLLVDSLLPLDETNTPLDPEFDIVFVHGLRGGLKTWRFEGDESTPRLWPAECLRPTFPKARLLAFTFDAPLWYATHKQHYSEIEVAKNFAEMSQSLRDALRDAGVGRDNRKVLFVCFSMGGLVVKRALVDDELLRSNTEGVVFFATPHLGSPIADYAHYTPFVAGSLVSSFVADLSRKSKQILSLHDAFLECGKDLPTLSVCETAQTDLGAGLKGMIVPLDSCGACGNRPGSFVIEAKAGTDHEQVSKISPELVEKDPRVVALINFILSIRK